MTMRDELIRLDSLLSKYRILAVDAAGSPFDLRRSLPRVRTCEHCHGEFYSAPARKTCSDECRRLRYNRRQAQRAVRLTP